MLVRGNILSQLKNIINQLKLHHHVQVYFVYIVIMIYMSARVTHVEIDSIPPISLYSYTWHILYTSSAGDSGTTCGVK